MEKKDLENVKYGIVFIYFGFFVYSIFIYLGHMYSNIIIELLGGNIEYIDYIRTLLSIFPIFSIFILIGIWLLTSPYLNIWGFTFLKKTLRTFSIIYFILASSILYSAITDNLDNAVVFADLKTIIWRIGLSIFLVFLTLYYYHFRKKNHIVFNLVCLVLSILQDVYYYSTKLTQLDNAVRTYDTLLLILTLFIFILLSVNVFIFHNFILIQYRVKKY